MTLGRIFIAVAAVAALALGTDGTAAAAAEPQRPAETRVTPGAYESAQDEPECVRIRGAKACVGPDGSDRPGITVEDTAGDRLHAAVEYYQHGYLGTEHVIHNLAGRGQVRGNREIGKVVTFRAALYRGDRRVKYGRWKTVQNVAKYPIKRDTRVTPAAARARAEVCTTVRGAAMTCFAERKSAYVLACDVRADKYQARAEYFVGGDPTTRFEIRQLAGAGTCGKAEHGELAISMYRAVLFDGSHRVGDQLYKYN
ncbi:hypothetical protein Nocox_39535 [Nonomuraea coxensis DSM 45129]|uniref:Uncharacterized protein n=1 Tax=Nonomuraea coxensis DSM 45129 TaxID=1122611 RepID=A0ABX8UCF4_9ACTN|nr:hypothetical protein [Nonomuraea coxensis]QYC45454.1 hypothetical protein Nocox_39535 [Nonomuraea coxensis DSM 45129]